MSFAVVHYLPDEDPERFYMDQLALLRPGELLVTADDFAPVDGALRRLQVAVPGSLAAPTGKTAETWQGWWRAAGADPALRSMRRTVAGGVVDQAPMNPELAGDHVAELALHENRLRAAGARAVGTVWQVGPAVVQVAVR